jgi:glucose/arabinose dehydrogenase
MVRHRLIKAVAATVLALGLSPASPLPSFSPVAWAAEAGLPIKLEKGDHICYVGNTLPDRMQHFGWLETLIYSRFPDQELVFRDLGYSGDEVNHRERCDGFGSPDEWLTREKADVIFAFFGFNESFKGQKGLANFKSEYDKWVKETLTKNYSGKGPVRLVLFSPIAAEDLKNPNLPNGEALNKNIKMYSDAMAEVARANNVPYVDLFGPTQELYKAAAAPLTINGIHMNEAGDRQLAPVIDKALFGGDAPTHARDTAAIEKLRQAVNDKNFQFFERYRTLDGYNVYGGRSKEKYKQPLLAKPGEQPPIITNLEVMQREMQVLEVMTENRDKRVQAVAQGKDFTVDDSNTPPFIPVSTNFPGKGPNGTHLYESGEDAIGKMKLAPGMKVNLFADEKKFPELVNPVQMAWDTRGRLWVACWNNYPRWQPKDQMSDKILIFEDTDGDGKADKCTHFLDNLNCPTGFEFYNGGIMLAQAPAIWFCKDTDGDDKADQIVRVLEGLDSADSHHTSNSFTFDPGGALYFQEGTFMHSQVETIDGPIREVNGAVWRFEPKTYRFDAYTSYPFANPHGHVFDAWGTDIIFDGTGAQPYYGPTFTGKVYFPQKHGRAPQVYKQRTRPCPGAEILSSKHFPDEMQGNLLVANVIGFQGILSYKLSEKGAGLVGTESTPIVSIDPKVDLNFRPSDIEVGPDGAIYFTDWQNAIIGHLQHHIRDPNRDHEHGRIYRITYEGRPLEKAAPIAGQSVEKLLDLLKDPTNRTRYRAKIELSAHDAKEVIPAVEKWIAALDKNDPNYAHQLTEGLWMYSWNNVVNEPLLNQVLASPEPKARAAATRVLCYWRDRVPTALDTLKKLVADDNPRVRLEAVRACSFFKDPKALEVALDSLNKDQDEYLKYALDETTKTLENLDKIDQPYKPTPKAAKPAAAPKADAKKK